MSLDVTMSHCSVVEMNRRFIFVTEVQLFSCFGSYPCGTFLSVQG